MKYLGAFLSVCLIFVPFDSKANQCGFLFDVISNDRAKESELTHEILKTIPRSLGSFELNGSEVLLSIFEGIRNAPDNSKVKIFSNSLKFDGIGALLLMVSVKESRKNRRLTFEFYLQDNSTPQRLYDLYAERSTNKIKFKPASEQPSKLETLIAIESKDEIELFSFDRDLTSLSLKNSSLKAPIPVNYQGLNIMRASPFIEIVNTQSIQLKGDAKKRFKEDLNKLVQEYSEAYTSKIDNMTDTDVLSVNSRAFDLALQLYILKKGKVPPEPLDSLEMLQEVLILE